MFQRALSTVMLFVILLSGHTFSYGQDVRAGGDTVTPLGMATDQREPSALLVLLGQPIAVLRASPYGYSPQDRVESIKERFESIIRGKKTFEVTTRATSRGTMFLVNEELLFTLNSDDVDVAVGQTMPELVTFTEGRLESLFAEIQRHRDPKYLLAAIGQIAGLLVLLIVAAWLVSRLERVLARMVGRLESKIGKQVRSLTTFSPGSLLALSRWCLKWVNRLLIATGAYLWLTFALSQFLSTRAVGQKLGDYLITALGTVLSGAVTALPDLIVVVAIFLIGRSLARLVKTVFARIERRRTPLAWIAPHAVRPTSRILIGIIWISVAIMMYPYLPGSDSEAFKGIGVFVGLLITLGGTSVVGQVLGGFVLMYTSEVKLHDYIKLADGDEGTVANIGFIYTTIRTPRGEDLVIPNKIMMEQRVRNYSRLAGEKGAPMGTKITIGYSTPWRQVHAMLTAAADETAGVRREPPPFILQRNLSDYYVEYELNVYIESPSRRIVILSELHQHIQDTFNQYGVQIMSPHYVADPAQKVWVPPDKWHESPAPKAD